MGNFFKDFRELDTTRTLVWTNIGEDYAVLSFQYRMAGHKAEPCGDAIYCYYYAKLVRACE